MNVLIGCRLSSHITRPSPCYNRPYRLIIRSDFHNFRLQSVKHKVGHIHHLKRESDVD